jgi:hypothetical protein
MSPRLKAALAYAERGLLVYPVSPGSKVPLAGTRGIHSGTTDPDIISGWWQRQDCNLGVVCGKASNLLVLDVDPRNGGDASLRRLLAEHGPLPLTVVVRTPSGGAHYWLRYPADGGAMPSSAGRVGSGLDVKGDGGGVVAPPSWRSEGVYEFAIRDRTTPIPIADPPEWLVTLARPAPRPSADVVRLEPGRPGRGYVAAVIAAESRRVADAAVGTRNTTLNAAAFRLFGFVKAGLASGQAVTNELAAAAAAAGLDRPQTVGTLASAFKAATPAPSRGRG